MASSVNERVSGAPLRRTYSVVVVMNEWRSRQAFLFFLPRWHVLRGSGVGIAGVAPGDLHRRHDVVDWVCSVGGGLSGCGSPRSEWFH
jgi:hypothetical protein